MKQFRDQTKAFIAEKIAQIEATKKIALQEQQKKYQSAEVQPKITELVAKKDEAIADVRKKADTEIKAINEATQKAIEELTAKGVATVEAMYGGEFDSEIALYRRIAEELGE